MAAAEASGDQIEILLGDAPAFGENPVEMAAVLDDQLEARHALDGRPDERKLARQQVGSKRIKGLLAVPPVGHEAGLPQQGQLRRYPRLAHPQDLLQLGHRQLLAHHERDEPEPGGVGQDFKGVPRRIHSGRRVGI